MRTPPHDRTLAAIRRLELSEMDAALLTLAVLGEASDLRIDTTVLRPAIEVAAYVHRTQTRPGNATRPVEPYIAHPLRNTLRLIRYGCTDAPTLVAAVLHDTVEDHAADLITLFDGPPDAGLDAAALQDRALTLLADQFGGEVAGIVKAVTNPPKPAGLPVEEKNRGYVDHVESVIGDPKVYLVKLADYVDNAGSVQYIADDGRRERLSRKYRPLVEIFRSGYAATTGPIQVSADGRRRIGEHLDRIGDRLS
ncbi:HD domain-containing protein [Rhodococcus kronopolitis]|uniref:HD domain-containing protein n=1 Tax=Rhodococcus kronopolitis TaxID=1460226 RepID=A0ABV9FXB0_9NOCA